MLFLLISLIIFLAVGFVWWWGCWRFHKAFKDRFWSTWPLQFSGCMIAFSAVHASSYTVPLTLVAPWIEALNVITSLWAFPMFGAASTFGALAGIVTLIALIFLGGKARTFSLAPALLIAAVVTVIIAEDRSKTVMCVSAKQFGATKIHRNTTLESYMLNWWLPAYRHASFKIDKQTYYWSYREGEFVPEHRAGRNFVQPPNFDCTTR